ncbi:transposase [Leptolyngbya cf. ectocarpi LEGE 11479]|uniref:Transposase n=1 Tax=Leptolyngbya cf. ectocarpi LEGE 11479 TaxID=1828722 RepID=A0A928X399_LEPEC|nr:transposase [Leptolyngbya ectocarpi]MBE9066799.1 transposase [Leptolyngbya cf. ectocarpi LEGE 11479]
MGNPTIHVRFSRTDCRLCPSRDQCTRSQSDPRTLTFRPQTASITTQPP